MSRVQRVIRNVPPHWVGDGFPVRSLFTYREGDVFDPFLLLDYAGPYTFAPAEARRGVGEHPHRGFETVTIVVQGELEHRDSSGSHGTIGCGDVQWMTAASGVVHEAFHSVRFTREGGTLEMIQLWVNLPAVYKMSTPRYQGLKDADISRLDLPGSTGFARVIAGELFRTRGVAKTFSPINVWDIGLKSSATLDLPLPVGHTALMMVQSGELGADDVPVRATELALFDRAGGQVQLRTLTEARLLILTGQPLREPVVGQGPFVMNTADEIRTAIRDYRNGRLGRLSG